MADEAEPNHQRSKSAGVRYNEDTAELDIPSDPCLRSTVPSSLALHKRRSSDPGTFKLPSHISLGIATMKGGGVEAGVYIKVDSLRPGQCFGLEAISGEMPQYSLLSFGCELVRVSLSQFREYACEDTLARVKGLIPTYPSDHFLWTSFKKQNHWTNFKNDVVRDVMEKAQAQSSSNTFAKDLRSSLSRTAMLRRRRVSLGSSFVSNIMPRISNVTDSWTEDKSSLRSKSRDGATSRSSYSASRPTSCQPQPSHPATSMRHDTRSRQLTALVTDHCTARAMSGTDQNTGRIHTARGTPSPTHTHTKYQRWTNS